MHIKHLQNWSVYKRIAFGGASNHEIKKMSSCCGEHKQGEAHVSDPGRRGTSGISRTAQFRRIDQARPKAAMDGI
jgi:hypothetical protein